MSSFKPFTLSIRKGRWAASRAACLLLLIPATLFAAQPQAVLVAPSTEGGLHVAAPAPPGLPVSPDARWQLVEIDHPNPPIRADVVPASAPDGSAAKGAWQCVASLPPRASPGAQPRRFRLEPIAPGPRAGTEPAFHFKAVNEKSLGLWEGQRPVFVYNHGTMSRAGVPADRNRSTYVHPLYGLDGEVLTDDFPKDHYHHRGLFWAWPHVKVAGKEYSLWDIRGIDQKFERWLDQRAGQAAAVLGIENGWYVGERKVVQERVWLRVYPADRDGQVIDCEFTWIPIGEAVTLAGAEEKSYGGLTLRFAPRTNTVITTPLGTGDKDLPMTRLPWADLSAQFAGAPQASGAAIFIGPGHPDYPPMWLTRHYGVLCVGWPGVTPATFRAGEAIRCRYRLWIHRQTPAAALQREYQNYTALEKITWEAPEK